jgi:hypothetical protein
VISSRRSRFLVPVVMAIGGSAIAVASLIGFGWKGALGVEVITVMVTLGYYALGGRGTDIGALFGSRADRRQADIAMHSKALTGNVLFIVALVGFVVATAMGRFEWPFALMCVVGAGTFIAGLLTYRRD